MSDIHEGDLLFVSSVSCLYGNGARATYKAPKGKVLVLAAVEVASRNEPMGNIHERATSTVMSWPEKASTDFAVLDVECTSVMVRETL